MKSLGNLKQQKLLVIGTQPAVLISLRTMLQLGRVHVVATDEPEVAIRLVENSQAHVNLALIDVCTVDAEPRTLAERLRAAGPGMKILFFSSLVDGEVIRLGILDHPSGVLRKEGVIQAIEEALAESDRRLKPERKAVPKTITAGKSFEYPM